MSGVFTICIIEMVNGWKTIGKSAPADARNFDPEVGKRYAYEDAFKPLWQFEGYLLRDRLWRMEAIGYVEPSVEAASA